MVDLIELGEVEHILVGIEIGEVCNEDTDSVTDLSVGVGKLFEDEIRYAHVHAVISRCRPKANQIGAVFLDHIQGIYAVTKRLVHCASLAVNHPAVGKDCLVGGLRLAACADCGQHGGLEPSAVLVGTLKIKVCGPAVVGVICKDREMR